MKEWIKAPQKLLICPWAAFKQPVKHFTEYKNWSTKTRRNLNYRLQGMIHVSKNWFWNADIYVIFCTNPGQYKKILRSVLVLNISSKNQNLSLFLAYWCWISDKIVLLSNFIWTKRVFMYSWLIFKTVRSEYKWRVGYLLFSFSVWSQMFLIFYRQGTPPHAKTPYCKTDCT